MKKKISIRALQRTLPARVSVSAKAGTAWRGMAMVNPVVSGIDAVRFALLLGLSATSFYQMYYADYAPTKRRTLGFVGVGTFAGALAFFFRGCIPQSTGTWVLFLILFTTFLVFVVLGGFETTQAAVAVVLKMNRSRKAKAIRARKVFLGLAIAFTLVLLVIIPTVPPNTR
eukprot:898329-Amorphochlora_amoeboformis.AAC.1